VVTVANVGSFIKCLRCNCICSTFFMHYCSQWRFQHSFVASDDPWIM